MLLITGADQSTMLLAWPHGARFHFLCLVTRSAASWSGYCYSM